MPLLRRAGVTLLLVPADTDDVETLTREMIAMSGTNQTYAVLANAKAVHYRGDLRNALWNIGHRKHIGSFEFRLTDWAAFAVPTTSVRGKFPRIVSGRSVPRARAKAVIGWCHAATGKTRSRRVRKPS
jgi:hypothetical protein